MPAARAVPAHAASPNHYLTGLTDTRSLGEHAMFGRKKRRIAELQRQLAKALGIIGERDDVIAELNARNERIHHDLRALRDRFPRLGLEPARTPAPWTCPTEGHTRTRWRQNVAHCAHYGCFNSSDDASWVEFDKRAEGREDNR